jgi:tetratricopeptide (TPR) repeat protein
VELEDLPVSEVGEIAEALGDVCERFGSYDRSADAYARALDILHHDPVAETRLAAKRGSLRERVGEYDEAIAIYEHGLALLDSLPETDELIRNRAAIDICAAGVRYRQGRFEDTVRWAERAAEHAERVGDRAGLAHAFYLIAGAYNELGRSDAIAYCERALPIFEELSDYGGMGRTLNTLGIGFYYAGRWDEAVASYRRGREALERAGDVVGAATLANNEGEVLSDQGRLEDAEAPFQHFSRVSRATGFAIGEGASLNNLARLDARAGRFDEAHALYAQAHDVFARIGSSSFRLEGIAREAECFVLEGRYAEAIALLEDEPIGDAPGHTAILVERTLGYALHQARRPDEARPHLEESLRLARSIESEYEEALSLRALAETRAAGPDARAAAEATFARLGVIRLPPVPLP